MSEEELVDAFERGLDATRGSCRASTRRRAWPPAARRSAGSGRPSSSPGAVIPAYVEREFTLHARRRPGPRPLGPGRHRAARRRGRRATGRDRRARAACRPVAPTLELDRPERVTITDYKSSDVRDPAKARQRARESLQLQIYAMGYEAMTGRLPDAVQLHFLDSGVVGRVEVDPQAARQGPGADRGRGGRDPRPRLHAEAGSRSRAATARSGRSARRASRRDADARGDRRDHVRLREHARPRRPRGAAAGRRADRGRRSAERTRRSIEPPSSQVWAEERERQFRENVPQFREVDLAERLVRVFARLRGHGAAAPRTTRWDQDGAARVQRAGRDRLGASTSTAARSSTACPPAPGVDELLAGLAAERHGDLAILSNWPLAATIDRYAEARGWTPSLPRDRRQPARRRDQAPCGDLRGGTRGARRSRAGVDPPRRRRLGRGRRRCRGRRLAGGVGRARGPRIRRCRRASRTATSAPTSSSRP